jgi:fatty acid desaturase
MEVQTAPRSEATAGTPFSLSQARQIVVDLYTPNPAIYFADFGLSVALGHSAFIVGAILPLWLPESLALHLALQAACLAVNILCWYRCSSFIHELVHLRSGTLNGFRLFYHAAFGIPCFLPTFLYYTHLNHHRAHYGTTDDAEYIPVELRSRWVLVLFVLQSLLAPLAGFLRFGVLSPLGWLIPWFRRRNFERRSSLVFDAWFLRPQPSRRVWRIVTIQEIACFVSVLAATVLLATVLKPWAVGLVVQFYLALAGVALVNSLRTITSHDWAGDHQEMTWEEQLLDSANFPDRPWLNELWAPVGLRYHATHHLFPTIPYHNLGIAHRRLNEQLPADSLYRLTSRTSFWAALLSVFLRAGSRRREAASRVPRPHFLADDRQPASQALPRNGRQA